MVAIGSNSLGADGLRDLVCAQSTGDVSIASGMVFRTFVVQLSLRVEIRE